MRCYCYYVFVGVRQLFSVQGSRCNINSFVYCWSLKPQLPQLFLHFVRTNARIWYHHVQQSFLSQPVPMSTFGYYAVVCLEFHRMLNLIKHERENEKNRGFTFYDMFLFFGEHMPVVCLTRTRHPLSNANKIARRYLYTRALHYPLYIYRMCDDSLQPSRC